MKVILSVFIASLLVVSVYIAQGPKGLVITAHPDDETGFPVTMLKVVRELKGVVDMAVMTDGGGGFADAQFRSIYYGVNLLDSVTARTHPSYGSRRLRRRPVSWASATSTSWSSLTTSTLPTSPPTSPDGSGIYITWKDDSTGCFRKAATTSSSPYTLQAHRHSGKPDSQRCQALRLHHA